jgi:hypothetical protein
MGLFECYAPKLSKLCWIEPEHVHASTDLDNDQALEQEIPFICTVRGMAQLYGWGWEEWHRQQNANGGA